MHKLRLPDGRVYQSSDAEKLEDILAGRHWGPPEDYREAMEMRAEQRRGEELMITGDSRDFFYEMERCGYCQYSEWCVDEVG